MLAAFARIRRLEREIERLEAALAAKKRAEPPTRANYHKWIAQNRAAIQGVLERLPLKPALVDQLVAEMRAARQAHGAAPRAGTELRAARARRRAGPQAPARVARRDRAARPRGAAGQEAS